jgi:hypothetical protein
VRLEREAETREAYRRDPGWEVIRVPNKECVILLVFWVGHTMVV